MTNVRVRKLLWDAVNAEHIAKHSVTVEQVEEVGKNQLAHIKGKKGRYVIIGRSGTRIISVILNRKGTGIYYPVTARDAAKKERKKVYEKEKK